MVDTDFIITPQTTINQQSEAYSTWLAKALALPGGATPKAAKVARLASEDTFVAMRLFLSGSSNSCLLILLLLNIIQPQLYETPSSMRLYGEHGNGGAKPKW